MADFEQTSSDALLKTQPGNAPPAPEDASPKADREYDRRGVLLPQRARVGGIITPQ